MTSNKKARPFETPLETPAAPEDLQGENTRPGHEEEEKLILTAWQSMSSALQQHSLCECSRVAGPAQSFLSKQRQSTQARRALSYRLQPR
ncbi:protein Hook homolog 2-like [Labrus mixtus]|uniref:protein Hook homolog 2-like n=1 Tax=Labrus mixtus TaxID=508554 RepID=UPI0029C0CC4B|nr:protein Hook homolog 2-like [Labrus mixtus]